MDIVLSPIVLANWFMGDGSSTWGGKWRNSVRIHMGTQGFSLGDVIFLKNSLAKVGIEAKYYGDKSIFVLKMLSVLAFMGAVKPFILGSYEYKVKKPWSAR